MNSGSRRSPLRAVLIGVAAIVVAALGLYLGARLRDRLSPPLAEEGTLTPPPRLAAGSRFPDVTLVGAAGDTTTTGALLAGGGVVMFLEMGCPPCSLMSARWQQAIDGGGLGGVPVIGIAAASLESIENYKRSKGVSFPIYSDPGAVFEREYQVTGYPFRVVVGRSMAVRAHSFDGNQPVEPERLRALLEP